MSDEQQPAEAPAPEAPPEPDEASKKIMQLCAQLYALAHDGELRALVCIPLRKDSGYAVSVEGTLTTLEACGLMGRVWMDVTNTLGAKPPGAPEAPPPAPPQPEPEPAIEVKPQRPTSWKRRLVPDGKGSTRFARSAHDQGTPNGPVQ